MSEETPAATGPSTRHYTNYVSSHWAPFDITIDFGCRIGEEDLRWLVGVTMTWEEARVLRRILTDALDRYENTVGEVRDIEGKDQPEGPQFSQNGGGDAGPDTDTEDPDDTKPSD
jgi:hypothetical protein